MTDDFLSLDLTAGQAVPGNQLMQLQSGSVPIRCVTVNNNSPLTVQLFPGMTSPQGAPALSVGPFQTQTLPIANTKQIAVSYSGIVSVSGFIYIHYMDQVQTSNAAPLPTLQTAGALQLISTGSQNIGAGDITPHTLVTWQLGNTANNSANPPTFTSQLFLCHLDLSNIPACPNGWQLFLENFSKAQAVSQFIAISFATGNVDKDYATPVKMYIPHAADAVGDQFRLIWQAFAGCSAGTLGFTINSYMT